MEKRIQLAAFTLEAAMRAIPSAAKGGGEAALVGTGGFWSLRSYQPVVPQENDLRHPGGDGRSGARSK